MFTFLKYLSLADGLKNWYSSYHAKITSSMVSLKEIVLIPDWNGLQQAWGK